MDLFELAKRIAMFLGDRGMYSSPFFVVVYSDNEIIEVQYRGTTVFKQCGQIVETHVPGEWESLLADLAPAASRAEETQTQQTEIDGRDEGSEQSDKLRESWGLDSADDRSRQGDEPHKRGPGGVMEKPAG